MTRHVGGKDAAARGVVAVQHRHVLVLVADVLPRRHADHGVRPADVALELQREAGGERGPAVHLPQRLGDDDRGRGEVGVGLGEPAPFEQRRAVDHRIRRVDEARRHLSHLLRSLQRQHDGVDDPREVRELVPLGHTIDVRPELLPVHRRAVGAVRHELDGRGATAEPVGLLRHLLLLILAERDDRGDRPDRHRDADEAQQHAQLVMADLGPRLAQRADQAAHEATSSGSALACVGSRAVGVGAVGLGGARSGTGAAPSGSVSDGFGQPVGVGRPVELGRRRHRRWPVPSSTLAASPDASAAAALAGTSSAKAVSTPASRR